ncbi:MAG TPA: glycosyl hydrolase [Patescibacteria group bacterium]|nr:glycosyl hydrolase [Patescibacteria group bacterium]
MKNIFYALLFFAVISLFFIFKEKQKTQSVPEQNMVKNEKQIYVGAWVGGFWENQKLNISPLFNFQNTLGKKMAIANFYDGWEYLASPEFINNLNQISSHGWVPMVSSNPYFFAGCPGKKEDNLYQKIASGSCDQFLKEIADNLKSYNKPILLRFAWEMNLPQMYWSIPLLNSTNNDFKNAWIHFHNVLKNNGAINVQWVLSFNTTGQNTIPYKELYPGDGFVDWVALDGYNWGKTPFKNVFEQSYQELTSITAKPIMLSETNSVPNDYKATWLSQLLTELPDTFPQIKAIIFFNEDKSNLGEVDWRIEKSTNYINSVKSGLNNTIYSSEYSLPQ